MNEIIYIPRAKLWPHPDNPRKDLGDLTELAESIKANGILQNLTVVPMIGNISGTWDGESYRVIIGHRRLAAAKLAGGTELPCVVTEMTQSEQIMTMLMENMQRADLTVYEQAQSFQMMLDLGETVESIAENSGFSTSTVRLRVKLLELDPEGFKKSEARGATLSDYMELDKLQDPERKNRALAAIGTANFANVLKKEQDEEKFVEYMGRQKTAVESFATRIEKGHEINGEAVPMAYILGCNRWSQREVEVPEDADTGTYYYTINDTATEIALYKRTEPAAEDGAAAIETEEQRQRRERREANDRRTKQIKEIGQRHFALRIEFVRSFSAVKKHLPTILHMAADAVIGNGSWRDSVDQNILEAILDEELPEDAEELELKEALDESMSIRPEKLEKIKLNNTEESAEKSRKEKNKNSFYPCLTSNTSNYNTNSKEHNKRNNFNFKKNNVIYLNITNYRNINPINPIVVNTNNTEGSENQYEPIISDENEVNEVNEFNLDEKILDTKIKSLEKERDFVVKNIINKYQNKIEKISKEKNNLLLKYSLRNENINLKNYKNPMKKYSNTATNNFGNNVNNNIKNKYDNTISTTTSNK